MPELSENKKQLATSVDADVMEAIKRLCSIEGVSQGELVSRLVRSYDAIPIPDDEEIDESELLSLPVPRDRDMLKDSICNLIAKAPSLHENYVLGALGLARAEYVKGLPMYKEAQTLRAEWEARREAQGRPLSYTAKGASLK
jgi:hypothetical protein